MKSYSPRVPCLSSDLQLANELTSKYKDDSSHVKLIGVSWRGGGKGERIRQKSIVEESFFELLNSFQGVRFVSLQYGNCGETD